METHAGMSGVGRMGDGSVAGGVILTKRGNQKAWRGATLFFVRCRRYALRCEIGVSGVGYCASRNVSMITRLVSQYTCQ